MRVGVRGCLCLHMYLQTSGVDLRGGSSFLRRGWSTKEWDNWLVWWTHFQSEYEEKGVIHLRGASVRAVSIKCSLFCGKKRAVLTFVNTYLSTTVFETRTVTGSELFSLLSCPHTTTITSLSIFSPLGTSSIKILETILSGCRPRLKNGRA